MKKQLRYMIEYSDGKKEVMIAATFQEIYQKFSKRAQDLKLSVTAERMG